MPYICPMETTKEPQPRPLTTPLIGLTGHTPPKPEVIELFGRKFLKTVSDNGRVELTPMEAEE